MMRAPTEDISETVTGLGGAGVAVMLVAMGGHCAQAHPMIPMLQVCGDAEVASRYAADLDLVLGDAPRAWTPDLLAVIEETLAGKYAPKLTQRGQVRFQLTRGDLGVSL